MPSAVGGGGADALDRVLARAAGEGVGVAGVDEDRGRAALGRHRQLAPRSPARGAERVARPGEGARDRGAWREQRQHHVGAALVAHARLRRWRSGPPRWRGGPGSGRAPAARPWLRPTSVLEEREVRRARPGRTAPGSGRVTSARPPRARARRAWMASSRTWPSSSAAHLLEAGRRLRRGSRSSRMTCQPNCDSTGAGDLARPRAPATPARTRAPSCRGRTSRARRPASPSRCRSRPPARRRRSPRRRRARSLTALASSSRRHEDVARRSIR